VSNIVNIIVSFAKASIFLKETILSRHYENPPSSHRSNGTVHKMNGHVRNGNTRSSNSVIYNGSMMSNETDQTYISTVRTNAYIASCGSSIASNGGSSQVSLLNGNSIVSNGSQTTSNAFIDHNFDGACMELDDNTKLSFRGAIGSVSLKILEKRVMILMLLCAIFLLG
jgi:hypothetical protein